MLDYQCFLKIFYNLSKLLIISNLTLQTFNFMTFYTELIKYSQNFVQTPDKPV